MENRLKIRISSLFRSSFSSCKSKNNTTDVFQQQQPVYYLANQHQHRQLIEIFSPKHSPFVSVNVEEPEWPEPECFQTHRRSCSLINKHLFPRPKLCAGHRQTQKESLLGAGAGTEENFKGANEIVKKSKRRKKIRSRSRSFGIYEFPACSYNGLFSSDEDTEEEDDKTTFFSSKSLSSDSSELLLRRSKDRCRRRKKTATRKKMTCPLNQNELPAAGNGGFAVVKRSKDPYGDFMSSMVEMITEKQIFAGEDLEKLLQRFLSLNSDNHHRIIIQVFKDIWEALFINS